MSTKKEILIKGITEEQLRKVIQEELEKFKLEIAQVLIAAYEITKKS